MTAGRRCIVALLALLVLGAPSVPSAAQTSGGIVTIPAEGEAAVDLLGDGSPVWVVHQPGGAIDVLAVGTPRLDPDAVPFAPPSVVSGVRSPVSWVPSERVFIGGSVAFDAGGRALGWFPIQVGGAEDAGPVPVRDLDAYEAEQLDDDRVRVGALVQGAERTVPANPDVPGFFETDQVRSPLRREDDEPVPLAEALALPDGTVALVDVGIVVDGLTPARLCAVPNVPVPDLPTCPDGSPEPVGVTAQDPDPAAYNVEFGPFLARVTEGTLADLIGGGGSAGRYAGEQPPPGGFDDDPSTLQRIDGETPADLAVAISRARFRDGRTFRAVLARDDVVADAVTGAVLTRDGPLLFAGRDALPPQTLEELRRVLAPRDPADGVTAQTPVVHLIGGTAAISGEVERSLTDAGFVTVRLAGPTRVETAIAVAGASRQNGPEGAIPEVLLARADAPADDPSEAWADAVAGGGWAAASGTPVLLTPGDAVHPAVQAALADFRTTSTVLLGGTDALSDEVVGGVPNARRVAGGDRTATAAAIATDLWRWGTSRFVLFDGYAPDGWTAALAGAGLSGDARAPLLVADAGAALPPASAGAVAASCAWRPVDAVALGDVGGAGALGVCPDDAPAGVVLEVTADTGGTPSEEVADVVATLRNDTAAPLLVEGTAAVADIDRLEDDEDLFTPVLRPGGDAVEVAPGATVEVLRSSPFPAPENGTVAGRYVAAVSTSAGTARTEFFIEFLRPE